MSARRRKNSSCTYQVAFDGGLQSNVRAELVNEFIKYILYERQQMPLPFEQIKRDVKTQTKQNGSIEPKQSLNSRIQNKKVTDIITKLDNTCHNILQAFEVSPEIKTVAIIIGATPVSPKEVYLVELPPLTPDADNLPAQKCIKSLFYQMFKLDPLCRMSQIHPTNTAIMLFAPRHANLSWFFPKPQYKIPPRGKQFHFQLQSSVGHHGNHNLSNNFSLVDLSGFEPLDSSVEDVSLACEDIDEETASSSSKSSVLTDYVCVDSDQDFDIIENSAIADEATRMNKEETETNCSKLSTASSKGSNKSYVTTSDILTRPSAFTDYLSPGAEEGLSSPLGFTNSQFSTGSMSIDDERSPFSPNLTQDYMWFQSPVFLKGYRERH